MGLQGQKYYLFILGGFWWEFDGNSEGFPPLEVILWCYHDKDFIPLCQAEQFIL